MKSIILTLIILSAYLFARSQTPEDSVKATVNLLFTAMKRAMP